MTTSVQPMVHVASRILLYGMVSWFLVVGTQPGLGQTSNAYPMLMSVSPAATVAGQSTEHELSARYNLAGGLSVWVSGQGLRAEIIPNEAEKPEDKQRNDVSSSKCKIRFHSEPGTVPGIRDFRVMTSHGVSTVGQIVVAREPLVVESANNDTLDQAQLVTIPATLCGAIEKGEDLDFYRFHVEQPGELTFHMTSQRLQNRLHDMQVRVDPMLTLRNGAGVTLASSDNALAGDPLLHVPIASPGEYVLEVRDVRYQGNPDWTYAIECSSRPFVLVAHPLAFSPNQPSPLQLIGLGLPADARSQVTLPSPPSHGIVYFAPELEGVPLNAIALVSTSDPILFENPTPSSVASQSADGKVATASTPPTSFAIPAMLCGQVATEGESDSYVFEAKAQETFRFEVFARRLGSSLDGKLRIMNESGGVLAEVDDTVFDRVLSSDPVLETWTAPADGKYLVEIRDLHGRGGPAFPYAIHGTKALPYFLLEADTDKTVLSPGTAGIVYVKAHRRNGFAGDIELAIDGLPTGVHAVAGRILASGTDGAIWLSAAPDASIGVSQVVIRGTANLVGTDGTNSTLSRPATILQEVYMPGGGRGHYPVESHAVSVANPMDIQKISISSNAVNLRPGESQRIDITIERAPGYQGNVTLDVMLQHLEQPYGNPLPKGVSIDQGASKTLLTAGESTGHITLKAAADAPPVEKHLVPITVHVSINFVMKHTFSSEPFFVTVSPP